VARVHNFGVLFALILASLGCSRSTTTSTNPANRPALHFTDVTAGAGIRFIHENGATGLKLLPETMSGGVVVLDYDADGRPDVLLLNGGNWTAGAKPNPALYRNLGNGQMVDVTSEVGLTPPHFCMGGAAADFDQDGFTDLFITGIGGNRLYRNIGGKRFEDVTEKAGLASDSWPNDFRELSRWNRLVSFPSSATWLDFDGDAKLDLFVCQYVAWSPLTDLATRATLPGNVRAYVPPTQFPGTQCQLYRNLGDGRFRDVTFEAGIEVSEPSGNNGAMQAVGKSLGVVACDPDADGWPDLLVANDTVRNFYFHNIPDNKGGRRFEEIGLTANAAHTDARPRGGMGIDTAYLDDGRFVAIVANFSNEPNTLLTLVRRDPIRFQDTADAAGISAPSRERMKFGALFFDADLDGIQDLLTVNGHLEPDIGLARTGQIQAEAAQLFRGQAAGKFVAVSELGDLGHPMVGRGTAYLDYDGDGDLDLILASNGGPAKLFRNDASSTNNWVRLKLVGDGVNSNREAIGATILATVNGVVQRHYVTGSRGYLSQSELTVTIGLGSAIEVESVVVEWPGRASGTKKWSNLTSRKEYRFEQ
jgi:enediyne biosynthesis protein E4